MFAFTVITIVLVTVFAYDMGRIWWRETEWRREVEWRRRRMHH